MVLWPYLQAFAFAARQVRGLLDHAICSRMASQALVLALLLFHIYIYYLPLTISRKFAYADD